MPATTTPIYSGNRSDYTVILLSPGVIQITDDRPGSPDGIDRLEGVERIVFANNDYWVEPDGSLSVINDAPLGQGHTLSVDEDVPHAFSVADFPFTDTEGNQLLDVIVTGFTGGGTLSYNGNPVTTFPITVSAADLASGLLVFTPAQDANGNGYATLQFQVQDDGGTAHGGADTDPVANTITIDVTAVNDAPTVVIAPPGTATEQIALNLKNTITIADVDAGSGTIVVTISVDYGIINATAGGTSVIVGNNGTSSITLTGTLAQIQALLSSDATSTITYTAHTDNPPASAQLTVSANDGGNSGEDPGLTGDGDDEVGSAVQTITITPVNDAPAVDLNGATAGIDNSAAYTENAAPAILAAAAIVADPDDLDLVGATVTIGAGHEAGLDRLTIGGLTSGTVGGITFNFTAGTMTLTGTASVADYQAALRMIAFNSTSDNPPTTKTVSWTVNDGDTDSAPATTTINVTPVNDAPTVLGLANNTALFIEGGSPVLLDAAPTAATLTDPDSPDFDGGSLTVAIGANGVAGEDVLSIAFSLQLTGGVGTVSFGGTPFATYSGGSNGNPLVFNFDSDASLAAVQALIRAIQYNNTNTLNPSTLTRTVTWTLVDGDGIANSGADTRVLNSFVGVSGVNDEPSGQDKTLSAVEDTGLTLNASDFTFSDVDGHSFAAIIISELPTGGTLFLNGNPITTAGTFVAKTQIDNGELIFQPSPDGNGTAFASFKFQVVDGGGQLNGGQDTDQTPNTITFDVAAVNDAPVNSVPTTDQEVDEDGLLTFNTANGNLISISDVDAGSFNLTVTLVIIDGVLTLSTTTGLTVSGNGSNNVQLTGTLAAINAALDGLTYAPPDELFGARTLLVTTSDNGNSGTDPGLTGGISDERDQDAISITILSLNDAPEGTSNAFTINEDATLTLTELSFGFSDPVEHHAFAGVLITTIPVPGTLLLDGVAVTRRPVRHRGRHRARQAHLPARSGRQRHAVHQLHLPGARRWRHRQWRPGHRPEPEHADHQRHRAQRRADQQRPRRADDRRGRLVHAEQRERQCDQRRRRRRDDADRHPLGRPRHADPGQHDGPRLRRRQRRHRRRDDDHHRQPTDINDALARRPHLQSDFEL